MLTNLRQRALATADVSLLGWVAPLRAAVVAASAAAERGQASSRSDTWAPGWATFRATKDDRRTGA